MYHKAQTEKERQKIFDDYLLGIKKKQIIKKIRKSLMKRNFMTLL